MASLDPQAQIDSLDNKLVAALHKSGEVFKSLLLRVGQVHGLSPIQVQIIMFVAYHPVHNLRTVSYLAKELNLTKATVSDAVRVLYKKGLVEKVTNEDTRSYSIHLTDTGKQLLPQLEQFDSPLKRSLEGLNENVKADLLHAMLIILDRLEEDGILSNQRMCLRCKYLSKMPGQKFYCTLLEKRLDQQDLRIDCPEFVAKALL